MTLNDTCPRCQYPFTVTTTRPDQFVHERPLFARGATVVGVDEVGRGALAGPMTVGAVVLNCDRPAPDGLTDSKRLTPARRAALTTPLEEWAVDWAVGSVSALEVDQWGVRLALAVAATRALEGLRVQPTHALLDGPFNLLRAPNSAGRGGPAPPPLRYGDLANSTLVRGDQCSAAIAASSVLAKVHRDRVMMDLHVEYEAYGWVQNKGYGVPAHLEALRRYGPTPYHRKTWQLPLREYGEPCS